LKYAGRTLSDHCTLVSWSDAGAVPLRLTARMAMLRARYPETTPSMSVRLTTAAAALALACTFSQGADAQLQRPSPAKQPPATDPSVPSAAKPKLFPTGMQWTLVNVNGKAVSDNRPTMMVDEALRARGFGGCNTFSATAYPLPGQRFVVGPIAVTRRACDKGVMDREKEFLLIFRTAAVWDLKDGQLVFQSNNGVLKFERTL
jgi:heat shock protein HslJ